MLRFCEFFSQNQLILIILRKKEVFLCTQMEKTTVSVVQLTTANITVTKKITAHWKKSKLEHMNQIQQK